MGDSYVESIVSREKNKTYAALRVGCYVAAGICAFLGIGGMYILLIGTVVFALLGFFVVPDSEIEFEYTYIDKELRIDKIIAQAKRKKGPVYDLNKMEFICKENSHELDRFKNKSIPTKDFSSLNSEVKPYVMVIKDEKSELLVKLDPVPEILKAIKSVMPRKVIEY